ncbi:Exoc5 [Acrasis kona]|uniref:Exoc5 n=1 Tax=Acrasis kona TaxID=1008807 RepID=A0AAW2YSZ5_9EUKA
MDMSEATTMNMIENIFSERKQNYINIEVGHLEKVYKRKMDEIRDEENRVLIEMAQAKAAATSSYRGLFSTIQSHTNALSGASPEGNSTNKYKHMPGLNFEVVVTLINECATALSRCRKLSTVYQLPDNMSRCFKVLATFVGDYIDRGITAAMSTIEVNNPKLPPKTDMYQTLQLANSMLQKVQQHLEQQIIPHVSINVNVQLQCVKTKDDMYGKLELKVVKSLELLLKAILSHVQYIFEQESKKTTNEYKPKENINLNQVYMDHKCTTGCARVCKFLEEQVQYLSLCLYGSNRELFLSELGSEFYRVLTTQLKNFSVNSPGAIVLMRDLGEYQKCMRRFEVQAVDDLFDALREVSNLFLVAPQNMENVLGQLDNKKMSKEEIHDFVKMRTDYKTEKLNRLSYFVQ